ncbi:MAG: YMGG-like glycine zipper-containing protein [Pseudomonadota bacterium]
MKKIFAFMIVLSLLGVGCASSGRYNTQKGAAIGAGLGAITGQIIGRNTKSTLIGTGVGTLLGTIFGNLEDQRAEEQREIISQYQIQQEQKTIYVAPEPQVQTGPPGRWVTVPGRWMGNVWVPSHQEWRPVQPE